MLRLGIGLDDNDKASGRDVIEPVLVLNAAVSSLKTLSVVDRLHVTMAEGHDIGSCLPDIQHISCRIEASDEGVELAQEIMELESLLSLHLDFVDGPGEDDTLIFPKTSMVEELILSGPLNMPNVSIEINKTGVELECSLVHKVSTANVPRTHLFQVVEGND